MRSLKNKPLYNHLTTASRYVVRSQRALYLFGWSVHSGQFSLWHWSTNAVLLLQISWEPWNIKKAQQDRNVPQCPLKLQGKTYPPFQKQTAPNLSSHLHSFSFNLDIIYLDTSFIEWFLTWVFHTWREFVPPRPLSTNRGEIPMLLIKLECLRCHRNAQLLKSVVSVCVESTCSC